MQEATVEMDGQDMSDYQNGNGTGPGRPPVENPSDRTQANRRSNARRQAYELADDADLPERLRFDQQEKQDVDRILYYAAEEAAALESRGRIVVLCDDRGVWRPVSIWTESQSGQATRRTVNALVKRGRAGAILELSEREDLPDAEFYMDTMTDALRDTNNHLRGVHSAILNRGEDFPPIDPTAEYVFGRDPVLPMQVGGAWDIAAGSTITRNQLRDLHMVDVDWSIPTPDLTAWDSPKTAKQRHIKRILQERYGDTPMKRLALGLFGPDKRIDTLKAETSNFGKNSLFELLKIALGGNGCVVNLTEGALERIGGRFSQAKKAMVSALFVSIDEVDKLGDLAQKGINSLTNTEIDVETKGVDAYSVPRTATLYLLGNDWPSIDMSATGMNTRFGWAYEWDGDEPMSKTEGYLMRDPECAPVMLARLLELAHDLWRESEGDMERAASLTHDSVSRMALEDMRQYGTPLETRVLQERFRPAERSDYVPVSEIHDAMEDAGMEKNDIPKGKAFAAMMRRFAPNAKSERRTEGSNRFRVWTGITKK